MIPYTQLDIASLIQCGIIFPYIDGSYVIPPLLVGFIREQLDKLRCLEEEGQRLKRQPTTRIRKAKEATPIAHTPPHLDLPLHSEDLAKWKKSVTDKMAIMVKGLSFQHLGFDLETWWTSILSLSTLGELWERIIASSLAVVYYLHLSKYQGTTELKLSDLYLLPQGSKARNVIDSITVDFSDGIHLPQTEVKATASSEVPRAVIHNVRSKGAHHDILLYTTLRLIGVQCKNSLDAPDPRVVIKQLNCDILLWFYPGLAEDRVEYPRKYSDPIVLKAIRNKQLAFLSGAGCASPLVLDSLLILKRLLRLIRS